MNRSKILLLLAAPCLAGGLWLLRPAGTSASSPVASRFPHSTTSPTDGQVERFAERVRRDGSRADSWILLGDALMQKGRETLDASYSVRAEEAYRKALGLQPASVDAMVGLARATNFRHEFELSVEWARKALARDSKNHAAYGLLGDAAVENGAYDEALEHYQKMLDIRPDLASYSRGAHLLFLTGDTRKAAWLMQKAAATGAPSAENTAWCKAQLALMLWNTGAIVSADQILEAALRDAPANYHLLAAAGRVKASKRDYPAAIGYYQRAAAITPQPEVLAALGDLHLMQGNREEAEKQFALLEQIHRINKGNGMRGDLDIARFYADHDRHLAEALRMAEAEYKARPNIAAADTLAWTYYKNGRFTEARRLAQRALALRTPDAALLYHAGVIYAKAGDRAQGKKYLYQALSLNPNFHPVKARQAADLLKELGS